MNGLLTDRKKRRRGSTAHQIIKQRYSVNIQTWFWIIYNVIPKDTNYWDFTVSRSHDHGKYDDNMCYDQNIEYLITCLTVTGFWDLACLPSSIYDSGRTWVPCVYRIKFVQRSDSLKFTLLDCSASRRLLPDMSFVDSAFTFQSTIYFIQGENKLVETSLGFLETSPHRRYRLQSIMAWEKKYK